MRKTILILAGNLNLGRSYLITTTGVIQPPEKIVWLCACFFLFVSLQYKQFGYSLPSNQLNDLKNEQIFCKWCITKNHTQKNTWRSTALHFPSTFFARVKSRHIHFFWCFLLKHGRFTTEYNKEEIHFANHALHKKSPTKEYKTWHSFTFSLSIFCQFEKHMYYYVVRVEKQAHVSFPLLLFTQAWMI